MGTGLAGERNGRIITKVLKKAKLKFLAWACLEYCENY